MTGHRRCPKPFPSAARGTCKLCGKPIVRPDGSINRYRQWHDVCHQFWELCTRLEVQRSFLRYRDGDNCAVCERPLIGWKNLGVRFEYDGSEWLPYTAIDREFCGEVEHRIPLWKARYVKDVVSRVWYYGPDNLQLICPHSGGCHKRKSKAEAAERAHLDRVVKPKKKRGPKMRSRGFDTRFTRKFNGQVVRRDA